MAAKGTGWDASGSPTPYNLGLLLVHGIGEQRRGDTIVHWLDTILETLLSATGNKARAVVEKADLASSPAHAAVRIQGEGIDERWLVAEAW